MRLQSTEAACGPCGVSNALKALGLAVSEADVSSWLNRVRRRDNPGAEGTSEPLLSRAVMEGSRADWRRRSGVTARGLMVHDRVLAVSALRGLLLAGCPVLLAVDADEHWVVAAGVLGTRFLVVDGADPAAEITLSYDEDQLLSRWEQGGNPPLFYGLVFRRGR